MQALLDRLAPDHADFPLARSLDPARIPRHIAIIMDGNGRWARQRNRPRVSGHQAGVAAVRAAVETCARLRVETLTLYAFSLENWKRPSLEVETLWRLLRVYLRAELASMLRQGIRFCAIGRLDGLPKIVREELDVVIRRTERNTGLRLNLAINYSGRAEIVDAVSQLVREGAAITEDAIAAGLYTSGQPDPDLLIRTSGEMRVSNFLLWQIAYSELYVTETLWPDFRQRDLLEAILEFQRRDRRFGGLGEVAEPAATLERVSRQAR